MREIQEVVQEARNYAKAYRRQYSIRDRKLILAIFYSHLAYLVNSAREGK